MIELNHIYREPNLDTMARMPDCFVDSIVTDPPYELGFMGKKWDSSGIAYSVPMWKECLRVLKPGGYLLAFGGTRTSHRMVCAIEDAGFEIRDSILWLYGSGFPKSMDISKQIDKEAGIERKKIGISPNWRESKRDREKNGQMEVRGKNAGQITEPESDNAKLWEGWGTALKPAHEPICVARKPISEKTVAENVLNYGTGGINIDGCRIELTGNNDPRLGGKGDWSSAKMAKNVYEGGYAGERVGSSELGRFPANIILDPFTAGELDKQAPEAGAFAKVKSGHPGKSKGIYGDYATRGDDGDTFYDDKGGCSRFFYIAKSDKGERNEGLYQFEDKLSGVKNASGRGFSETDPYKVIMSKNNHPTVKPVKLIQYLIRLVTPKNGVSYDPFGGSGTHALASQNEGFKWIMSEQVAEYCDIANKRVYNNGGLFL
jgi:DNA modification methylase